MRHILYIIGALLVYLIVGKIAEVIYFSIFPFSLADMPGDMLLTEYEAGVFRRQIWMHAVVAFLYVLVLGEKQDWIIYAIVVALYCSFNDVNTALAIAANIACVAPMIAASWVVASRDSAKAKYKHEQSKKQSQMRDQ